MKTQNTYQKIGKIVMLTLLALFLIVSSGQSNYLAMAQTPDPPATEPTTEPTDQPTGEPTGEPTQEPTTEPMVGPTTEPTDQPTEEPTVGPTIEPTEPPTGEPTGEPTQEPPVEPIVEPTSPIEESTTEPIVDILLSGDVNDDGMVDILDLAFIVSLYNSNDPKADISGDGVVNIFDLSIVAGRYNQGTSLITPVPENTLIQLPTDDVIETDPMLPSLEEAELSEVAAAARFPISALVRVTIKEVTDLNFADGTGSGADMYPKVTIDGETFEKGFIEDRGHILPTNWIFSKEVSLAKDYIPIRIEIWDEDDWFRGGDDHLDITERNGSNLTPDLGWVYCGLNNPSGSAGVIGTTAQLRVSGPLPPPRLTKSFVCKFDNITSFGRGKDRAAIRYSVEVIGLKYFDWPINMSYPIDNCFNFGQACGNAAAHAFCTMKGFEGATRFSIVRWSPTRTLGDKKVCNGPGCHAFEWINCYRR